MKRLKRTAARLLSLALVVSMLLVSAPMGIADSDPNDFSQYFAVPIITQNDPDKSPLPNPVPKNQEILIEFDYTLTAELSANTEYTFALPPELVAAPGSGSMTCDDCGDLIASIVIGADGACTITFTDNAVKLEHGYLDSNETGKFYITTQLNASRINNATGSLSIAYGNGLSFPLNFSFPVDQITGSVLVGGHNSAQDAADLANNRITWTANVTPTLTNNIMLNPDASTLTDFYIDIALHSDLTVTGTPTLTLNGIPLGGSASYSTSGTTGTLRYTITGYTYTAGDEFAVEYKTTYDMGAFASTDTASFTNTASASFKYPQYNTAGGTAGLALSGSTQTATSSNVSATKEISARFLSKEQTQSKATQTITWTLEVNKDAVGFTSGFDVTDTIPEGLRLDSVTLDGTTISSPNYVLNPPGTAFSGGILTVPVTTGAAHTIVYTTTINPTIWQTETGRTFANNVSFNAQYGGTGYGFSRNKSSQWTFGGTSGGLIGASGSYDRKNHTYSWTVNLNSYLATLSNGTVTVFVPDGQTFIDSFGYTGSAVGSSEASWSNVPDGKEITITLPASVSAVGSITFKTTVNDVAVWGINQSGVDHYINATLNAGDINLFAKPSVAAVSEVIKKTAGTYNYNTRILEWSFAVNQNLMAMTNPVITDVLPAGTSYVGYTANAAVKQITDNSGTLTIELNNFAMGSGNTTITIQTHVDDDSLLATTGSIGTVVNNTASLTYDELTPQPAVTSSASKTIGIPPLIKSGAQNLSYRNYTWTVQINTSHLSMPAATLVDVIPTDLLMDLESVKLYEATYDGSSKLTKGTKVYDGTAPGSYPNFTAALSGQDFSFTFTQAYNRAYILEFDTDNTNSAASNYNNRIWFSGDESAKVETGDVNQGAAGGGGTANPNRGAITLTATASSTAIAGITYTISDGTNTYTAITNTSGTALFPTVKFGAYSIVSVQFPGGEYLPLQDNPTVTISSSARTQSAPLTYAAPDSTSYTLDYNANGGTGTGYSEATYADGANVTVKANPYTRTGYEFTGWNTQDDGDGTDYAPSSTLMLTANTTLYAQWRIAAGTINVTVEDTNGDKVQGITVNLDGIGAGSTSASGELAIPVDGLGTYTVSIVKPDGYLVLTSAQTATISDDGDTVDLTFTLAASAFLTYDAGTGIGTAVEEEHAKGGTVTLKAPDDCSFTNPGYRFIGWEDENQDIHEPGYEFPFSTDTTLTAQWSLLAGTVTVTVTSDSGNAEGAEVTLTHSDGTVYTDTTDINGIASFTVPPGVYTVAVMGAGFRIASGSSITVVDQQITAVPVELTCTLTYDANDGSGTLSEEEHVQDAEVTLKDNMFSRSGYQFTGWNTEPDGTGDDYAAGDTLTLDDDVLLYAQWAVLSGSWYPGDSNPGSGSKPDGNNGNKPKPGADPDDEDDSENPDDPDDAPDDTKNPDAPDTPNGPGDPNAPEAGPGGNPEDPTGDPGDPDDPDNATGKASHTDQNDPDDPSNTQPKAGNQAHNNPKTDGGPMGVLLLSVVLVLAAIPMTSILLKRLGYVPRRLR